MTPYVMIQLNNTNQMRGFGPSNVLHNFRTIRPKPNEPFSGSDGKEIKEMYPKIQRQ